MNKSFKTVMLIHVGSVVIFSVHACICKINIKPLLSIISVKTIKEQIQQNFM
jgi:hypothetical protein